MKLSPTQAALLNARERQLLQARGPYEVKALVARIRRTRELRDKQRDLAQRQRLAATGRQQSKASATVLRTRQKERLFDRALVYYETQLARLEREAHAAAAELGLAGARRAGNGAKPGHGARAPAKAAKPRRAAEAAPRQAAKKAGRAADRRTAKKQLRRQVARA